LTTTIGSDERCTSIPGGFEQNSISVDISTAADDFAFPGRIWSASDGFLRVFASVNLDAGARIELAFEGCSTRGEVAFCQQWPGGYNIGVQLLSSSTTRREPRFPIQATGSLNVLGDQGPHDLPVDLCDVSASGLGMFVDVALPVGVCIEVKLEFGILFGEVRHCEKIDGGRFRTGMKMFHMIARETITATSEKPPRRVLGWFKRRSLT
jgi:hypothetical protein